MNTGIMLMGVLLAILIVSPFVFFRNSKRKSKEKELLDLLRDLAGRNNSTVTNFKIWNNSAIAIDKESSMLLFVVKSEKQSSDMAISLAEVKNCKVVTTSHVVKIKNETNKVTDVIALALESRVGTRPDIILEFYNNEFDGFILDGESLLADEWARTINVVLHSIRIGEKV